MSYYPTERREGCMESISRCCRQVYVYPLDTRKLLYAGGAVVGIILIAVIWSGLSSPNSSSFVQPFKGGKVLQESPLVVGSNFFAVNLRNLVQNNISKVNFDHNLSNDTVFGNTACKSCQTDIPRLQSGFVGSQIWSLRVPCEAEYKDAVALTLEQVDAMSRLLSHYSGNVTIVKESSDVTDGFRTDRLGGLLAVTSGHSFDGRMSVLRTLHNLGVRVLSLTSNCSTAWASSYSDPNDSIGLTSFGAAVVKEMNRLGMLIDLSEASHKTQLDVLSITKAPVVFTRAAAYGVVNNSRNIKDDVLQKLKENGGIVMVTFAAQYLNNNITNISISDVIKHLNYMKNITGVDKLGIGAEYDAQDEVYPAHLHDVSTFPTLFDRLGDEKWSENDLKKLAGQNFLRVLQAVEKAAKESASLPADESFKLEINSDCYSDYNSRSKSADTVTTNQPTTAGTATTQVTNTTVQTTTPSTSTMTTPTTLALTTQLTTTPSTLPTTKTNA
ncbi:dipeptidase 1-like [Macrosteles quadrilineatus]|uniref:dipeptidase 1-like n=1 Tax=Macrosteles quadrilineatus TaxID=74068 RepID=UPI0023E2136A|nr:dipeptidase 1-like [Macrosteles quadrilineatus]XP_054266538.1 dipeptidase 1-like [Macrosteles quadrilineatus]XP_054266539.1 dipeptidase 1-like [Macrosteles quadrilineatus]